MQSTPPTAPFNWHGLATAIAENAGLAELIRSQHKPDSTGHCIACRQEQNGCAQVYPCNLVKVADMAITIRNGHTRRPTPSDLP